MSDGWLGKHVRFHHVFDPRVMLLCAFCMHIYLYVVGSNMITKSPGSENSSSQNRTNSHILALASRDRRQFAVAELLLGPLTPDVIQGHWKILVHGFQFLQHSRLLRFWYLSFPQHSCHGHVKKFN